LIRTQNAIDDFHQRALAGAVLTQQGMDLPGLDVEVDRVVCDAAGKDFMDPGEGKKWGVSDGHG
jgi:hypothetical protein